MILYDEVLIKENQPLPAAGKMLPGTLKSTGSGVAIWKPNGYVLTVTPGGAIEQRPDGPPDPNYTPGSWETFRVSGGYLVADREGHVYAIRVIGA